jgi:hypothetical protein
VMTGDRSGPEKGERCAWCDRRFRLRCDGGKAQRFCSQRCRRQFDAGGRAFVRAELASGRLTVAELRNAVATTRALPTSGMSSLLVPEQGPRPGETQEGVSAGRLLCSRGG